MNTKKRIHHEGHEALEGVKTTAKLILTMKFMKSMKERQRREPFFYHEGHEGGEGLKELNNRFLP